MKMRELLLGHLEAPSDVYPESYIQGYVEEHLPGEASVDTSRLMDEPESSSYWKRDWVFDGVAENPLLYIRSCAEISALSEALGADRDEGPDYNLSLYSEGSNLTVINRWSFGEIDRNFRMSLPETISKDKLNSFGLEVAKKQSEEGENIMEVNGGYEASENFSGGSFETSLSFIDTPLSEPMGAGTTKIKAEEPSTELRNIYSFIESRLGRTENHFEIEKTELPTEYISD